jgi:hypothetical protein
MDYSDGYLIPHRIFACELFDRSSPKNESLSFLDKPFSFCPCGGFVKGFFGSEAYHRHTSMPHFFRGWILF